MKKWLTTVRLIDERTGKVIWSHTTDRPGVAELAHRAMSEDGPGVGSERLPELPN